MEERSNINSIGFHQSMYKALQSICDRNRAEFDKYLSNGKQSLVNEIISQKKDILKRKYEIEIYKNQNNQSKLSQMLLKIQMLRDIERAWCFVKQTDSTINNESSIDICNSPALSKCIAVNVHFDGCQTQYIDQVLFACFYFYFYLCFFFVCLAAATTTTE